MGHHAVLRPSWAANAIILLRAFSEPAEMPNRHQFVENPSNRFKSLQDARSRHSLPTVRYRLRLLGASPSGGSASPPAQTTSGVLPNSAPSTSSSHRIDSSTGQGGYRFSIGRSEEHDPMSPTDLMRGALDLRRGGARRASARRTSPSGSFRNVPTPRSAILALRMPLGVGSAGTRSASPSYVLVGLLRGLSTHGLVGARELQRNLRGP